jgi:hypothetical protein
MRGRRPAGPAYVEQLQGSPGTKRRLKVILQTVRGELSLQEACARLGLSPQRFHQLRQEALQGALAALEPRPLGRPPREPGPADARLAELEHQLADVDLQRRAAEAREEIALVLPRAAQAPAGPEKKTRRRR